MMDYQGANKPAFPAAGYTDGMSLREWYAGTAMQGLLGAKILNHDAEEFELLYRQNGIGWNLKTTPANLAALAFDLADAMLAEAKKPLK